MILQREAARRRHVYTNVCQMLIDRGYTLPQFNLNMIANDTADNNDNHNDNDNPNNDDYVSSRNFISTDVNPPFHTIKVYFCAEDSIKSRELREYIADMERASIRKGIVIVKRKINSQSKKIAAEYSVEMEFFTETDFLINVTHHKMVPKHTLLDKIATEGLFRMYRINHKSQLPKLQITDPVCRYYGYKTGDVIQITRPSETVGECITFRVVK